MLYLLFGVAGFAFCCGVWALTGVGCVWWFVGLGVGLPALVGFIGFVRLRLAVVVGALCSGLLQFDLPMIWVDVVVGVAAILLLFCFLLLVGFTVGWFVGRG